MLEYVSVCCRLIIGGTFLLSGSTKLRSLSAFQDFWVATESLLGAGHRRAAGLAAAAIAMELLIVVALAFSQFVVIGFVASGALLAVYSVAIGLALGRGERTPCRCIGASSEPLHPSLMLRNVGLVAICGVGLWSTATAGTGVYVTTALAASVAAAFFGVVLIASFDDIVYLARRSAS